MYYNARVIKYVLKLKPAYKARHEAAAYIGDAVKREGKAYGVQGMLDAIGYGIAQIAKEETMKKRLLAGLLVLCMVLALGLTACSGDTNATATTTTTATADEGAATTTAAEGDGETTAAEGGEETTAAEADAPATWENLSWEKDTSPITFSCYIDFDWYPVDTWGEDEVSKEITRLTGVSLDVTKGSDLQVLSVQLAAQELSDLVFTGNLPQRFQDPDVCYRWDELAAEYCPEFMDLVDPLEKVNNQAADGHIYTFITHYNDERAYADDNSIGNFGNFTLAYRADVMEKLNLPMFTSIEELDETFYKVKEQGADMGISMVYNVHPDWSYAVSYWMGCADGNRWDPETKSIKMLYNDTTWLEYYKLMNKWYRDGILVKDYLGVRPEDFMSRDESGQVFATAYNAGYAFNIDGSWRNTNKGGKVEDLSKPFFDQVVEPLTYKGEVRLNLTDYSHGFASCFISTNCENPGRAITFMEFMKSPQGDQLCQWGIEGVHYTMVDGLPKNTDEFLARPEEERLQTYTGVGPWYLQGSGWAEGVSWAAAVVNAADEWTEYGAKQNNATRLIHKNMAAQNKNPAMAFARVESEDDEMAAFTKLADQWKVQAAAMITAESEAAVEQIWNDFQAYAKANGLDAVEAKMTQRYVENLKRYQDAGFFTDVVTE